MNPHELVDHIGSGPAKLVLDEPRRRTRSNPCNFNEFIKSLQASETIRDVICCSYWRLGIAEDEWVVLLKTLGSIRDIQHLEFTINCSDSCDSFRPFHAIAQAANNANKLRILSIGLDGAMFPRDPSVGLTAFANALRKHKGLQEFSLIDRRSLLEVVQSTAFDPVLRALSEFAHIQMVFIVAECASADTMRNLLQFEVALGPTIGFSTGNGPVVGGGRRNSSRSLQCEIAGSCYALT
jgi:hypothetical protein